MGERGRRREFFLVFLFEDDDRTNLIVNVVKSYTLLGGEMRRRSEVDWRHVISRCKLSSD